ncbi:helix-turn-helix domain-containing protein [Acidobacterium sp. S8]|uniref:helix-turn-helix domain-containing protein n=1 Tax=Acidobacterium sp. S8 TaxID=1641854 RepID=UPI00131D4218|nr:helix-turn-helix domain-containing protein [Acidobacterium sp. S8]
MKRNNNADLTKHATAVLEAKPQPEPKRMRRRKDPQLEFCLTPRQVARDCGFGVSNTYRMLAQGILPSIRVGNRYFVPRLALARWLENCGRMSQQQ